MTSKQRTSKIRDSLEPPTIYQKWDMLADWLVDHAAYYQTRTGEKSLPHHLRVTYGAKAEAYGLLLKRMRELETE